MTNLLIFQKMNGNLFLLEEAEHTAYVLRSTKISRKHNMRIYSTAPTSLSIMLMHLSTLIYYVILFTKSNLTGVPLITIE